MIAEGFVFPPEDEEEESFDSLNIFPGLIDVLSSCVGTQFMKDLRVFLDYYVSKTLQRNPNLRDLNVIVSDSDVPGEGEHKIMEFFVHNVLSRTILLHKVISSMGLMQISVCSHCLLMSQTSLFL